MTTELGSALNGAVEQAVAYLRSVDADAASEVDAVRRRDVTRPAVVVVGETKRGKSSLVNALVGVPDLAPVDVAVTTSAWWEFVPGAAHAAQVWLPERADPIDVDPDRARRWAGPDADTPPDAGRPRRVRVSHPAPLLQYLKLVDTPGAGGLDPAHAEIALDAVERATALLFVVDASAPLSRPELDFLVRASERVNAVVFALTKIDAYPDWRVIADDNRGLLRAYAPRFAAAPWFPVSPLLAELALRGPGGADLVAESRIPDLQHALVELAGRGHLLQLANVLRAVRGELVRLDRAAGDRLRACDADPAEAAGARAERAAVAARKRTESRQWSLALTTEAQRARLEAVGVLRAGLAAVQNDLNARIDAARGDALRALPADADAALQALAVRLSADVRDRFRQVGERALAQVFADDELQHVLGGLNATLRHALAGRPRRDAGTTADNVMIAMSAGSVAFMAGRGAMLGASVLSAGGIVGGTLLVPFAGVGLGLAAGGYVLYRRRVHSDRQQARAWLREVLAEARAAMTDEITHRFTDLQYALTLALDDAIERRLRQLDAHLAEIDAAVAADAATRARRKAAVQADRDALRARLRHVDEVLARTRVLTPVPPAGEETP
jgi:Dynamin family